MKTIFSETVSKGNAKNGKECKSDGRILTIEQLMDFCKVDTRVWEARRGRVNSWEVGTREATSGLVQVKVPLTRIEAGAVSDHLLELLGTELEKVAPKRFPRAAKGKVSKGKLMEVSIPDHIGIEVLKTGKPEGLDSAIARGRSRYEAALVDLVSKASGEKIGKILLPVSAAFCDLKLKKSMAGEWTRVFLAGAQMLSEAVELLAQVAPVDIVVVNEKAGKPYLGIYLSKWFRNHPTVRVDTGIKPRKYYTFQYNMIGFTSDKSMRASAMPTVMSTENPVQWSKTRYAEIHYGEGSSPEKGKEYNGVSVKRTNGLMQASELLPRKNQIVMNDGSEAYLYSPAGGMDTTYYAA